MRCRSCDYPLWTIRARQCPECGAPFAPSQFEFARNAVRFQCPHCAQTYYGTSERGHLVPRAFACVGCGQHVDMDEMVLTPAEGVDERLTTAPILAWLDKKKRRTAAWRTIGMAMSQPRRMMDLTPVESSVGRALWFYTLVMLLVSILSGVAFLAVGFGMIGGVAIALGAGLGVVVVGIYAFLALWGLTAHGLMKLLGAQPQHTIGRTFQALCYTSGVMMPSAVPCVGFYLLPLTSIWWMIAAAFAVPRAHGARAGRGAVGVLILPALLYGGTVGWFAWQIFVRFPSMSAFQMSGMNAYPIYTGLMTHASLANGAFPDHGVRLVVDGSLVPAALTDQSAISGSWPTIGGVPASAWERLTFEEQDSIGATMAAALPKGWAAHRLGDVVFTYNGINATAPQDPGLWLFVFSPDPAGPGAWMPGAPILAMRADAMVEQFDQIGFARALASQNTLRQGFGLPPIPDPTTVLQVVADPDAGAPTGSEDE